MPSKYKESSILHYNKYMMKTPKLHPTLKWMWPLSGTDLPDVSVRTDFFFLSTFFPQQNVMNDLNMTNTILDTFSVKYSFPHFTFLFNCSLQKQEQQIGGFATVHL